MATLEGRVERKAMSTLKGRVERKKMALPESVHLALVPVTVELGNVDRHVVLAHSHLVHLLPHLHTHLLSAQQLYRD